MDCRSAIVTLGIVAGLLYGCVNTERPPVEAQKDQLVELQSEQTSLREAIVEVTALGEKQKARLDLVISTVDAFMEDRANQLNAELRECQEMRFRRIREAVLEKQAKELEKASCAQEARFEELSAQQAQQFQDAYASIDQGLASLNEEYRTKNEMLRTRNQILQKKSEHLQELILRLESINRDLVTTNERLNSANVFLLARNGELAQENLRLSRGDGTDEEPIGSAPPDPAALRCMESLSASHGPP